MRSLMVRLCVGGWLSIGWVVLLAADESQLVEPLCSDN